MTDSGRVEVAGGSLSWDAAGEGTPLVLLHGFSFDRRMWRPQMEPFAREHRVVGYDLRGFGTSTVPDRPYRHSDDLRFLLHALALEKPILVGLSLGANVALAYAMEHPREVAGVVLASPGLPGHVWTTPWPPDVAAAFAAAQGVAAGKEFWLSQPLFSSVRQNPPVSAALSEMVGGYSGWHWTHRDLQAPGPDIAGSLSQLQVPLWVISGDRDVDGYRQIARRIAAEVPGAQLSRLADAGHVVNLEQPARFNELVLEFARGVR